MVRALILVVLFAVAWTEGGWWWGCFGLILFLMMVFRGNKAPVENQGLQLEVVEEQVPVTPSAKTFPVEAKVKDKKNWGEVLTNLCAQFEGDGLFVAEHISEKKLETVQYFYPPPMGGKIIALLDVTVMGSAKCGLAISTFGLSWRNDWAGAQPGSGDMLWKDFVTMPLSGENRFLEFNLGEGNSLNVAGASFSRDRLHELLTQIQVAFQEFDKKSAPQKPKWPKKLALVDINSAGLDALIALPAIGAAEAHQILQHRRDGKHIGSMEELAALVDLKPHHVVRLQTFLQFSSIQGPHDQTEAVSVSVSGGIVESEMPKKVGRMID